MSRWLEDFVYRTEMNPLIFLGSALAALFIAILTISFHTFRAANLNPVDTLRNE
jgi:putative ABC transport system permease protein